jgi:hypothetical protein
VFGGWDGNSLGLADAWYSSSTGAAWSSVVPSSSTLVLGTPGQGVGTCVDVHQQVLYSVGGGINDQYGTNQVYSSSDLGQTWSNSTGAFDGRYNPLCLVDSSSNLYVIAGKHYNMSGIYAPGPGSDSGDDISNDVWIGTQSGGVWQWTQQTSSAPFLARDGPAGASYYSYTLQTDVLYLASGYLYNSATAQLGQNDNGIGTNDGQPHATRSLVRRSHLLMLAPHCSVCPCVWRCWCCSVGVCEPRPVVAVHGCCTIPYPLSCQDACRWKWRSAAGGRRHGDIAIQRGKQPGAGCQPQ